MWRLLPDWSVYIHPAELGQQGTFIKELLCCNQEQEGENFQYSCTCAAPSRDLLGLYTHKRTNDCLHITSVHVRAVYIILLNYIQDFIFIYL